MGSFMTLLSLLNAVIKVDRNLTNGNCRKGKILFEPLNYPTLTITEIFVICSNQNNFCSPTSRLWFANLISQTTETSSVFFKFSYSCGILIWMFTNRSFYLSPGFLNPIWYMEGEGAKKHLTATDFEYLWPLPTIEIKRDHIALTLASYFGKLIWHFSQFILVWES